jgi:hypothetical protein
MTTIPTITAGNVVEATVTFVPESGTVLIADVSARLHKADGTDVTLTGITGAHPSFEVEWASADTDITGRYQIRWESNSPSPKIVVEDATTAFVLIGSVLATP